MIIFRIKGIVKEKETGLPLPNLFVKSYDKDLFFDDLLGSAITDQYGKFEIMCDLTDFREFFDVKPDIYFKVFSSDRSTLIHSTKDAVRWKAGKISDHEILIPWKELHDNVKTEVTLTSDRREIGKDMSVGGSLTIEAKGLKPGYAHDISLTTDGKALFSSTLMTNRYGKIEPTVLWPQMGLDDPNGKARYTPEEAVKIWKGKSINLAISAGRETISKATFKISDACRSPIVISSEIDGRLLNGFEVGTQPLFLTLFNLPFGGDVRIYLVERQHDWHTGDAFRPVTFSDGKPAVRELSIREGGGQQTLEFVAAELLAPGAYDFIVRPLRYGYEEDEVLAVLPNDVISSKCVTGVVIRESFWAAKPVLGGCVNKIPVSGRAFSGMPYFRYSDTFTMGEDVWAGFDPGIIDPDNISKMCALYVIQSKDNAGWVNNSLNHLPILGGNANTTKRKLQAGCMNANKWLVWSNVSEPGNYDIVADFGNNTPDANLFVQDNAYDTPLDIIDGYFNTGFRVVEDPGTMVESNIPDYGTWHYTEADFPMYGVIGTVSVQDEIGSYHISNPPTMVNRDVRMKAHVFYPADEPNVEDPAQISSAQPDYPLIVIIHGNGHDYTSYDALMQHFARNGFIAASIDVRYFNGSTDVHHMRGQGRAEMLFYHLTVLQGKFTDKMQNNIGIMGHSRGGEAVIKAARINQQQGYIHNINAVISLAPTDQCGTEVLAGEWAKPYFVLYGSRDGDVKGGPPYTSGYTVAQCGFALYDRANINNSNIKSMCFVYKATHNGFITSNSDTLVQDVLDPNIQKAYTWAYMNAFFRWHLKDESHWEGMFKGEWTPGSISSTGARSYIQYHDTTIKTVDDFEGEVDWQVSTIDGTLDHYDTLPVDPSEGKMSAAVITGLDPKSPHDTQGMIIRWDNIGDKLEFTIPPDHKDISAYSVISFRVSQKVDSQENSADQSQNLRVALKDGTNNERAVRVSPFYEIPYPDMRPYPYAQYSKSAMNTIRIPLKAYTIVCAGQAQVNLHDVTTLTLLFSEKSKGEIEIDDVEFSN